MKKALIVIVIILLTGFGLYQFGLKSRPSVNGTQTQLTQSNVKMVLYVSDSCPHCKNVEDYLKDNPPSDPNSIAIKEVSTNRQNAAELNKVANDCPDYDASTGVGVPFAYLEDQNTCLVGDTPIVDYLQSHSL